MMWIDKGLLPEPTLPTTATSSPFSTFMLTLDNVASSPPHENVPFSTSKGEPIKIQTFKDWKLTMPMKLTFFIVMFNAVFVQFLAIQKLIDSINGNFRLN